ncbi:MAG: CoA pyrophosphatase [Anaerolineales bacterium]|uniref:NUDIX hydrolase n=1 Tax=Promineifilum sp. TaxID=2664178 RepID=UPI001E154627|nr:CoA pyrophosphatase [Anaerolineales bacterium]MCO5181728.1 CoA pyrophosphatase [Promineifilum sp.]
MPTAYSLDNIRAALALPGFDGPAAQRRMAPVARPMARPNDQPNSPRLGGILILLYCVDDEFHIVLTQRPDYDGVHAGQVSCPGGRHEPPETLGETALRETWEEIGIPPADVELLGQLTPLYVMPSDFEVHPFVGRYTGAGRPRFVPDPREVAAILEVPLRLLLDPATRAKEEMELRGGLRLHVPFFRVGERRVWGATAMMLSELVERIRALGVMGGE